MVRLLLIGMGGFIGSVFRYLIGGWVQGWSKSFEFPYGTLAVNVLGCLVLGFLAELAESHGVFSIRSRAFLFIGVLGGFTTFSAFSGETFNLSRDGQQLLSFLNIAAHIALGVGAVWAGRILVQAVWR